MYAYIWSTEMLKVWRSVWPPISNSCVCRVGQWLFRMVFRFIFRRRCRNFCFCKVGDENAFSAQFASFSFPTRTNFISAIVQIINRYPIKTLFMLVFFHTQMSPATPLHPTRTNFISPIVQINNRSPPSFVSFSSNKHEQHVINEWQILWFPFFRTRALDRPYEQGLTGRGFLLRDGTGRVLAKKFGYRDGSGRVVRRF